MLTVKDGKKVNWKDMPLSEMAYGNVLDSTYTLLLYDRLLEELGKLGLINHYNNLLSPLSTTLAEIELLGMKVDQEGLDTLGLKLEELRQEYKAKLYNFTEVKPSDKVSSNKDLVDILYLREGGFNLYPPFRTKKTGTPQVDNNTFETIEAMIEEELETRKYV